MWMTLSENLLHFLSEHTFKLQVTNNQPGSDDDVGVWHHVVVLSGAVLLDLKQSTLPGIAQQVVEQMVISDQIKAEDRANVLRALLLRHRFGSKLHLSVQSFIHSFIFLSSHSSTHCCSEREQSHFFHKYISLSVRFISHPSDEKDHSLFSRNISAANMAALMDRSNGQSEPSNNLTNHREADTEKNKVKPHLSTFCLFVVTCWRFKVWL